MLETICDLLFLIYVGTIIGMLIANWICSYKEKLRKYVFWPVFLLLSIKSLIKGVWVFSPTKGYASDYSMHNVQALPNKQL